MNSKHPNEIILNVYFLGEPTDQLTHRLSKLGNVGLGLYHSGIEINGVEWSYGGDPNNHGTGVFATPPLTIQGAMYYQSYLIGTYDDSKKLNQVLNEVKREFIASEYSLIGQNCNHFSEEFCKRLLGKRIPSYINRLARMGSWVNFLLPQSLKSLNPIPEGGSSPNMSMNSTRPSSSASSSSRSSFQGKGVTLADCFN